ncbi:MAG: PDZ domain-containing protein [Bacillota bacterium]
MNIANAAGEGSYAGTFRGDELVVKIEAKGGEYVGSIEKGGQTFPLKATQAGGKLQGTFDSQGETFEFTASLEGQLLKLQSGGASYVLKKTLANPLARAVRNPLGTGAAQTAPTGGESAAQGEEARNAGVGMNITIGGDGSIVVDSLVENGPAARGGVRVGDRLVAIDDRPIGNVSELAAMLPGASGSSVKLKFVRDGETVEMTLKREVTKRPDDQAKAAAGDKTAGGVAKNAQKVQLVEYAIQDPQLRCPAMAFVAPEGWTRQGAVLWTGHVVPACITVLRVANPQGSEEFNLYPTIPFTTGDPQQAFGAARCRYMDPAECIREIIIPRCRPEAQQGRVLGYEEMPQMAKQEAQRIAGFGFPVGEVKAGRTLMEYSRDGRKTLEMFYCITTAMETPAGVLWSVDIAFSYRADKERFYGEMPLFNWMAVCLKENPQWTAARLARVRAMVNRMYPVIPPTASNSGPSILDVSKSISRNNDRFIANIDKINTDRLNTGDAWSSAFRNTATLVDPAAGEKIYNVQGANEYQRMFRTDQGTIYGSNDPSYDPWVNDHIRATELTR